MENLQYSSNFVSLVTWPSGEAAVCKTAYVGSIPIVTSFLFIYERTMGLASDLKPGVVLKYNGENCVVLDYKHIQPGRGQAIHQAKLKNLKSGKIFDNRFRTGEDIEFVQISRTDFQYLYREGNMLYFMNLQTYDQVPVDEELLGDSVQFLKENQEVQIAFDGDSVVSVDIPPSVTLRIVQTDPGIKGDSATNVMKPAIMETGLVVQVPLFINTGELIRVDTRDGNYSERVKE